MKASGDLMARHLNLAGESRTDGRMSAVALEARRGLLDAEAAGHAMDLIVNWSTVDRQSALGAGRDGAWLVSVDKGNVASGETRFRNATWSITGWGPDSNMLLVGAAIPLTASAPGNLVLRTSVSESWHAGNNPRARVGLEAAPFDAGLSLASGTPVASTTSGTFDATGDLAWYVWGVNVTVTGESGHQYTFRSGTWRTDEPSGAGASEIAHERVQFLRLRAATANVSLLVTDGTARAALQQATVKTDGFLEAYVEEAELASGHEMHALEDQELRVAGRIVMEPRRSASPELLAIRISFEGTALADGRPFLPAAAGTTAMPRISPPLAAILAAMTAVGLLGFFAARRGHRRESILLKAEEDLALHRAAPARAHARRLLRHNQMDSEAWFLYATGLLQAGDAETVLRQVEPVARRLPDSCRTGLALVIALAHVRLRHHRRAVDWLEVACIDPVLREHVRGEPAFADLRTLPKYRRMFSDVVPGYG